MQIRDGEGDPTPAGLAAGGTVVVVVAAGGAAAATNGSGWIAPVIALIGAVFVAVLTAVTTNRRQAKQLEDERARHERELEEERARLQLQLAHERDLGELAHMREIFDEGARQFEARNDALNEYGFSVNRWESDEDDQKVVDAAQVALDAARTMAIFVRRLALRLPLDHEVFLAYNEVDVALDERNDALDAAAFTPETFDKDEDDQHSTAVMGNWRRFVDVAREELERRAAPE